MAQLSSRLVISLVDRVSGPARGIAGSMRRLKGVAGMATRLGNSMSGLGGLSLAMPTALAVGSFGHNQYEWDKATHQFRAISEIGDELFGQLSAKITDTSNVLGVNRMELLDAAKGWIELGNSTESYIQNIGVAARASQVVGVDVAEQMKESSALLRAWGHQMSDADMYKHFEEVYLVASKGMKGGAHAFGEAMKSWAPIAAGLRLTFEEASAFAQTLGGQFEAGEIGNALKTGFMRLAAPVPKAEAALRSQGIDRAKLFRYAPDAVGNADALLGGLRGTGSFTITKDVEKFVRQALTNVDLSQGSEALVDKLNEGLSKRLGGKKMSAMDRKVLQQVILTHFAQAAQGLNPEEFFKAFGPLASNVAFMSTVFGKEHAAKFMDLLKQWEHFSHNLEHIKKTAPGALDRKWGIFGEGFFKEWDKVTTAWDNLAGSVGASGIASDMAKVFGSISGFLVSMQSANPQLMRFGFWVTTMLAALPLMGVYLAAAAPALRLVGSAALLAGGAMASFLAPGAGGLILGAGALGAGLGRFGRAASLAARGLRMLTVAGLAFSAAAIVYDNWQPIEDFLNGLGLKVGHVADEFERLKTAAEGGDWRDIGRWFAGRDESGKVKDDWGLIGKLPGFLFGTPAQGGEAPTQPPAGADMAKDVVSSVQAAMAQVQSIVAGVDLTAQGQRIAQSLANGIRSGTGAIAAAARDAAQAAQVGSAMRGAYSDGGR